MTTSLAFGSYVPGASAVHTARAQVKIILACAFSIGALFVDTWVGLGLATLLLAVLYVLARIPLGRGLKGLAPVLFILLFTVAVHALSFTLAGLLDGMLVAARIALIVFACMLLTFTTEPAELTDGLLWIMAPLRRLHLPVDDLAMVISLALRFIPLATQEAYGLRSAQIARCADFEAGSPLARVRAWGPVLVPLVVRLFRHAVALAAAMDARCYTGVARTHLHTGALHPRDWLQLAAGLLAITAIAVFL